MRLLLLLLLPVLGSVPLLLLPLLGSVPLLLLLPVLGWRLCLYGSYRPFAVKYVQFIVVAPLPNVEDAF